MIPDELNASLARHGLQNKDLVGTRMNGNPMQMILARRRDKAGKIAGAELGKRIGLQEGTNRSSRSMGDAMKPWLLYNGNCKDRSGERRWGERQGERGTAIVGGINKLSWPPARYAGSLQAIEQPGAEHPRGQLPRQIASRVDRQQPADVWPRVSSANTLFRPGTVSPVPPPPERRGWFTPRRHRSTRVVTGGRCRPGSRPPPRASLAGRACDRTPWGQGPGPGPAWVQKLR
jgi:hypothetical protein